MPERRYSGAKCSNTSLVVKMREQKVRAQYRPESDFVADIFGDRPSAPRVPGTLSIDAAVNIRAIL